MSQASPAAWGRTRVGHRGCPGAVRSTAVPITHTNAKGKLYYLHQGTTKTGKLKYHSSMQSEGTLAESIPAGFEIYENPNAQVFLRRIPPKIITDEERQVVEDGMRKYARVQDYKIDVRGNAIEIHIAHQDSETFRNQTWGPVRIIHSTEVLLIEYALSCLLQPTASAAWGYHLARQYAERYNSRYGTGLIPESAPMVEDIADFWCQYYLGKPLREWLGTPSLP